VIYFGFNVGWFEEKIASCESGEAIFLFGSLTAENAEFAEMEEKE